MKMTSVRERRKGQERKDLGTRDGEKKGRLDVSIWKMGIVKATSWGR